MLTDADLEFIRTADTGLLKREFQEYYINGAGEQAKEYARALAKEILRRHDSEPDIKAA